MKTSNTWIRDVGWVAWNEFTGSIRSRRTLMLIIMFSGLTMLFGWHMIQLIEDVIAGLVGGKDHGDPTAVAALWNSKEYTRLARNILGRRLQENLNLSEMPPIGWVYGLTVFTLTPLLVMLTSAPRIAEDIGTGTVRFAVVRTTRPAWCLGKYLGQTAQLPVALAAAGVCMWLIGWNYMIEFDMPGSALAILKFTLAAWVWGTGFLGLAAGVSQLTAKHHLATMFGVIALVAIFYVHMTSERAFREGEPSIMTHVNKILPTGYYYDLWTWDVSHLLPAVVIVIGLSLLFLFAGHIFFAKRDL